MGCVKLSQKILSEALVGHENAEIVGIVTKTRSPVNSDFVSLEPEAHAIGCPVFLFEKGKENEMRDWILKLSPQFVFCFGWSHLIPEETLEIAKGGFIGFHPASLPQNRGRHPIIWSLTLGLKETASTFFWMDPKADSGDLLSQEKIRIDIDDDASTLYRKLGECAVRQVRTFTTGLATGKFNRKPQNFSNSNYWRKRTPIDGQIDWRMSSLSIYNLVRALSKPYPGAHALYKGAPFKIWKVKILPQDLYPNNLEPGKILSITLGGLPILKTGDGAIQVENADTEIKFCEGDYL